MPSLRSAKGFYLVLTTVSSEREAVRLADRLVRSRCAACVNVIPRVESRYRWQGKLETGKEALLLIKTNASRLRPLCRLLKQLHSYEVPEILAMPIAWGSPAYLDWLQTCLAGPKTLDKAR